MKNHLRIFSGNSNPELARQICDYLNISKAGVDIFKFKNDNIFVQVKDDVREKDVYVIQSSVPPVSDSLMELLIMVDALRHASAQRITAVVPYYPYVRSDKKDQPRISITARLVADLITTAGADRILTVNLHSPQIHGFFRIPADHLLVMPIILNYLKKMETDGYIAVAPDAGSAKLAETYARGLQIPLAIVDKRRYDNDDQAHAMNIIGNVKGKSAIVFDDEVSTAGSLVETVEVLKSNGAKKIIACVAHGVFCGPAIERIYGCDALDKVIVTNTLPISKEAVDGGKIHVLSIASLLGEAIKRIHKGESISVLFK